MNLQQKVKVLPNICGLEIDASAKMLPAADGSVQPFANTHIADSSAQKIYFGKANVKFAQQSDEQKGNTLYKQSLSIRFPNGDTLSSKRISDYRKVKLIYITLSNGQVFLMGRNDYYQNTPVKIKIQNTEKLCQITYETISIHPIGTTNGSNSIGFPEGLPISFFIN